MAGISGLERRLAHLEAGASIQGLKALETQMRKNFASLDSEISKHRVELMLELSAFKSEAGREEQRRAQINRHANIFKSTSDTASKYPKEVQDVRKRCHVLESLSFSSIKARRDNIDVAHNQTLRWVLDQRRTNFITWLQSGSGIYWINGLVRYLPRHLAGPIPWIVLTHSRQAVASRP